MRIESPKKCPGTYGGWLHYLDENQKLEPRPIQKPRPKLADVGGFAMQLFSSDAGSRWRRRLADEWCIPIAVLDRMYVGGGYDPNGREFASFPSRDGNGRVVGIIRRYASGEKKTYPGTSNSGVFIAVEWWSRPGPVLIVEGASDTAIGVAAGLAVIGRPSNVGGVDVVDVLLRRRADGRSVVIVGENDRKPDRVGTIAACPPGCRGCAWCWPGAYGAAECARKLARLSPSILMPPAGIKDLRQWAAAVPSIAAEVVVSWKNAGRRASA